MDREVRLDGVRYFVIGGRVFEGTDILLLQMESGKLRQVVVQENGSHHFFEPMPGSDDRFVHSPWTPEEVTSLNGYQTEGYGHPFTTDYDGASVSLIATPMGWVAKEGGPVLQTWAWRWMSDDAWKTDPVYKILKVRG